MKEVINKMMDAIAKHREEEQKKPFQYVVAYYRTKDDTLIGYHENTFCQLTQEKLMAKRYNGENPYRQLEIIRKNLDSTLDATEESCNNKLFGTLSLDIKNECFKDLSKGDIWINAEYLDENIPPQRFEYQITSDKKEENES